jgi:uncharacterized membrane protein YjfL (UPF0719 family)
MNWTPVINSVVFALIGIATFVGGFIILDKLTPYDLWRELVEKRNTALAIVVGLASLGVCLIIAAAVHG